MSMILCTKCGELCDCDEYPEGFYRLDQNGGEVLTDKYQCQNCNERDEP